MNVAVSPTLTVNWNVVNNTPTITAPSVSGASVSASVSRNATGGMVNGRQLSWVGEEGPEMIIPLIPSRRDRAMELYVQAGKMLGVGEHAEGGIVGGDNDVFNSSLTSLKPQTEFVAQSPNNSPTVNVEAKFEPQINISSNGNQSNEDVADVVMQTIRGMFGEISDELAKSLKRKLANLG
jgi:SLT domain-containing protein